MGEWLVIEAVVLSGALLQGAIGFGVALVAAPLLMLIRPELIPAPMIIAAWTLTLLMALRDRSGVDWQGLRWTVPGLVLGTAAAVGLIQILPPAAVGQVFGVLILAAVALSAGGWAPSLRPRTLLLASSATGFMGTMTSVGGPPIALAYQKMAGVQLRGTLSVVFLVGGALSLAGLALAGRIGAGDVVAGLALVPGILAGFALSGRLTRHLDGRWLRPVVLAVSGGAAVLVLLRSL